MTIETPLLWLNAQNVSYKVLQYPANITTSSEAAAFLGIEEAQMLKSLLVKVGDEFVMMLTPLNKRLDMNVLMQYFSVKKSRMATPDEVFEITGYKIGTTCPFLLKTNLRIFLDQDVLKYKEIAISSGEKGKEIMISLADLQRVIQVSIIAT